MRWTPCAFGALLLLAAPLASAAQVATPLVCADASRPPPPVVGVLGQCPPIHVSGNGVDVFAGERDGAFVVHVALCGADACVRVLQESRDPSDDRKRPSMSLLP